MPNMYISANGVLTVGCSLVWFPFVCLCKCVCGVHACVHVCSHIWSLEGRNEKLEQEDSVSSVCPPQDAELRGQRGICACNETDPFSLPVRACLHFIYLHPYTCCKGGGIQPVRPSSSQLHKMRCKRCFEEESGAEPAERAAAVRGDLVTDP